PRPGPRRELSSAFELRLEELTELEVDLPIWCPPAKRIGPVETVTEVQTQRPQRRHQGCTKARAAEQTGWVEVPRACPKVAGIEERGKIQLRTHAETEFRRRREERATE